LVNGYFGTFVIFIVESLTLVESDIARAEGLLYTSFYDGARAFFAYLTWSPALDAASYQDVSLQYNRAIAAAIRNGTHTGTGDHFRAAVAR